jgi:hypothetical protein
MFKLNRDHVIGAVIASVLCLVVSAVIQGRIMRALRQEVEDLEATATQVERERIGVTERLMTVVEKQVQHKGQLLDSLAQLTEMMKLTSNRIQRLESFLKPEEQPAPQAQGT